MKQKVLFFMTFLFLASSSVLAQKSSLQKKDWKEVIADAKMNLKAVDTQSNLLIKEQVEARQPSKKITLDVFGMDQLLLTLDAQTDPSEEVYSAWFDAQLVDLNGKAEYLGYLQKNIKALNGNLIVNKKMNDGSLLKVGDKEFGQSIMNSTAGGLLLTLDKKYKTLQAEAGISGFSNKGTALYTISKSEGERIAQTLREQYKDQVQNFMVYGAPYLSQILSGSTAETEKKLAQDLIAKLQYKDFFTSIVSLNENIKDDRKKIVAYLSLIDQLSQVYQLQQQLEWVNIPAIEKALNDMSQKKGYDIATYSQKTKELKALHQQGFAGIYTFEASAIEKAHKALDLKREILLSNPLLDMDKLIVGRYHVGDKARNINPSNMGTQPNNWSNITSAEKSGFNGEIAQISNLRKQPVFSTIYKPETTTATTDYKLHWGADRLLFSMVEKDEHHWQLYEIGLDGKNLKQITDGSKEDLDYFDACYLPNGNLIVTSNIGGQGVPCVNGYDQVGNLCLFDPQTKEMRRLTFDQDANWSPVVMHNGRVMYIRWEYTDLTHYFSRIVMHMNQDGTEQRSLYGSGSVFPTSIYDVQPLPDHSTRFIGIISGHHGTVRSGRLIIFDPAISRKEEKGMVQELPFSNRKIVPIVKDQMVDGVWPQFLKPQPLNNNYFIVTAKLTEDGLWGIYLIDIYDNLTLIAEMEDEGLIYGIPVKRQNIPPVIPDKINLNSKESTVFIQDIYQGEGLPGVKKGDVKELRVFAYEYAYIKTPSDHLAQGVQSGWDLKRYLGTVPVEADGSAMFKIPANTPISLQPLDKDGAAIQWMRSWITGQPGETVSCVGCHEDQNQIPMPKKSIASTKAPIPLAAPEGGVRSITFDLEIQPILDRSCVACHDGNKNKIDFTGSRKDQTGFNKSYLNLHPYVHRQGPEAGMKVLYPYEYHVSNSPLIRLLKDGHYGAALTDKEWKALYRWIDLNAPDKGRFQYDDLYEGVSQYDRRIALNKKYANGIYAHWEKELKDYAAYLDKQPKAEPAKVNFSAPVYKQIKVKGFPFDASTYGKPQTKVIEIAPGVKLTFVKIPAGSFIMGASEKNSNHAPAFKAKVNRSFWMSSQEISNAQLRVFDPTHDSRYVDQQWKDHVTEGYPANQPEQVASRVSYNQAELFCQKASKKTGLKITLPTEVQWEWACRAGTDQLFWYGDLNADFGKFENMADEQTNKLAVVGVDPQPMPKDHPWYSYYSWLPKVESVDDGNMIMSLPGSYQSNPFGLYDMHGNVAEWTRSDYFPYPYNEKNQGKGTHKVVRGGSWKDHPKWSTSVYRRPFLPEQKPYNVGFRVIIEE